jgi:hypothetical protein
MIRSGLILIALFVTASAVLANAGVPTNAPPRWAADGDFYAVDGWSVQRGDVDTSRPGQAIVAHAYTHPDGTRASLVVSTSPSAKAIYRAGAAVPYLGTGYSVELAPSSLIPTPGSREAFLAQRGSERWLHFSTYGERRGQFGSGAAAWGLTIFDSLLGRPNDYYLARVIVSLDDTNILRTRVVADLADVLFARLAAFYGS